MKRIIIYAMLIILCFLLQATVFRGLAFVGIVPNLLIILCASLGFMRGEITGLVVGFFCGLLIDVFFGDVIGLNALLYMHIGYLNGKFTGKYYPENLKLPLVLIVSSNLLYSLFSYLLLFVMRGRFDFGFYIKNVVAPELIYTMLMALLLYPLLLWIERILGREGKITTK